MRNLYNYNVKKLEKKELKSINGGGFFRDFGRLVGRLWCGLKNIERSKPPGMTWNEFNGKF